MNVQILKNFLACSKNDIKSEIMRQDSLKDALIYCKINKVSGQRSGLLLETFIKKRFGFSKNTPGSCTGDLSKNYKNYEIKTSLGGSLNNKFNFVQIRFNHDCDYILVCYHLCDTNVENLGDIFVFRIPKEDMKSIIVLYGSYAHGTVSKNGNINTTSINSTKEYSIRPKFGDKCWKHLQNYKTNLELI